MGAVETGPAPGRATLLPDPEPRAVRVPVISVDDHLIEPPDLFEGRLPAALTEHAPRVVELDGGKQAWIFEGNLYPNVGLNAVVGRPKDEWSMDPARFDEMRPGCFDIGARLEDMDRAGVWASLCFPSLVSGFCGAVYSRAQDKELGLACLRAFNDWHWEAWAGPHPERIIPLQLPWLADIALAADEVRANAARGFKAVSFPEFPAQLKLPSIFSGAWDPFFAACEETGTVVCMHIGSSSKMPATSADAPVAVAATLSFGNAMASLTDFLFSGVLIRFPRLVLAYSEGQIGWLPYILERADDVWREHRAWGGVKDIVPEPPSTYFHRQVYGCFFRDQHGLDSLGVIGADRITFETDYPHTDSTWPDTRAVAEHMVRGLGDDDVFRIMRGNAMQMLGLGT
jgi:predicted TIM-barrel fold metal-dependent hydrolase